MYPLLSNDRPCLPIKQSGCNGFCLTHDRTAIFLFAKQRIWVVKLNFSFGFWVSDHTFLWLLAVLPILEFSGSHFKIKRLAGVHTETLSLLRFFFAGQGIDHPPSSFYSVIYVPPV